MVHDTPSHGSDHLCLIWKESIHNCRWYGHGMRDRRTDGRTDGRTDRRTDGRSETSIPPPNNFVVYNDSLPTHICITQAQWVNMYSYAILHQSIYCITAIHVLDHGQSCTGFQSFIHWFMVPKFYNTTQPKISWIPDLFMNVTKGNQPLTTKDQQRYKNIFQLEQIECLPSEIIIG